jgi:hypothetical protein
LLFLVPYGQSVPELCKCPLLSLMGVWQTSDASCDN